MQHLVSAVTALTSAVAPRPASLGCPIGHHAAVGIDRVARRLPGAAGADPAAFDLFLRVERELRQAAVAAARDRNAVGVLEVTRDDHAQAGLLSSGAAIPLHRRVAVDLLHPRRRAGAADADPVHLTLDLGVEAPMDDRRRLGVRFDRGRQLPQAGARSGSTKSATGAVAGAGGMPGRS